MFELQRRRPGMLLQKVGDETVIFDLNGERFYSLDAMGTRFWELLGEFPDENAVVDVLVAEYEVERDVASADLAKFIGDLRRLGIVE